MSEFNNTTKHYDKTHKTCDLVTCSIILGVPAGMLLIFIFYSLVKRFLGRYKADPLSKQERIDFVNGGEENTQFDFMKLENHTWDAVVAKRWRQNKFWLRLVKFKDNGSYIEFTGNGCNKYGRFTVTHGVYKNGRIAFLTNMVGCVKSFGTSYSGILTGENTFSGYWINVSTIICCGNVIEDTFKMRCSYEV